MKIQIKNFGPIKEFELDLSRNLTVVYGENNIGKSYTMSLVYLLIKNIIESDKYYEGRKPVALKGIVSDAAVDYKLNAFEVNFKKSFENTFGKLSDFNGSEIRIYKGKAKVVTISIEGGKLYLRDADFSVFSKEFLGYCYFIPASRSGLYFGLRNLTPIFLKVSQNRDLFLEGIRLTEITEPQSDYFLNLTSIGKVSKQKAFVEIAKRLEDVIIEGSVDYDSGTNSLYFKDKNATVNLQLDKTSSMVSEISLITAFFKYVINNGNVSYPKNTKPIIFIEEPEAHLHPSKQVKFAEILGEIVKTDSVRIVISSHSNYIFNKLNNMIMAKELDFKKYSAYVLKKGKKLGSTAKLLKTDELGSDDENFSDVSDKLYSERMSIIDKMNKKNGKK